MTEMRQMPTVSVIMPVYNGLEFIARSLPPLIEMMKREEILEVIVVDDSSTDETAKFAKALGAQVIPSGGRLGPGAARNMASQIAKAELLWFVDADVVVHDDAARKIRRAFSGKDVVAVFGCYDDSPPAQNFLSQYKNLVHHYYHTHSSADAATFWSGCGGIRASAFSTSRGFDTKLFKHPSIEDIELGYRLLEAGGRIRLISDLKCTHLKEWRFWNLIHTEIVRRALPWSRLMLQRGNIDDTLNVSSMERLRAFFALVLLGGITAALLGFSSWYVVLIFGLLVAYSNWKLVRLFYRRKGVFFAIGGLLFHQMYYIYSCCAFAWAVAEQNVARIRSRLATF